MSDELPSDYGYSVGDLVVPLNEHERSFYGVGLVFPKDDAVYPWPVYWFSIRQIDPGWRWQRGQLVKVKRNE